MNLKVKIMLVIFSVAMVPIIIMAVMSSSISTEALIEKEVSNKINIVSEISDKIYLSTLDRQLVGINFLLNANVQHLMTTLANKSNGMANIEKLQFEIEKMLQNYKFIQGTEGLYIYTNHDYILTNKPFSPFDVSKFLEQSWFTYSMENERSYFWGDPVLDGNEMVIPLVRVIKDIHTSSHLGYFISTIRESYFHNSYENFVVTNASDFYIVNERGVVISQTDKNNVGLKLKDIFPDFSTKEKREGSTIIEQKGVRYLITFNNNPKNSWMVINIVPWQELYKSATSIQHFTYILSAFLIVVCFVIALFLSKGITKPINQLSSNMKRAENGDWDVEIEATSTGEIGQLERSFSLMLRALQKSVAEKISIQKQKRRAELRMLEYQINPHFLYNTLSSIIWLSENNEKDLVITIASAISELFRISISKGTEIIPIFDEIAYVKHYLEILNIRYQNAFDVEYNIEDLLKNGYTIKLILQPLVENAIKHGIKPSAFGSEKGKIIIKAEKENSETVVFRVMNSGNLLSNKEVDFLNSFLNERQKEDTFGIGARNVNDRIQLAYGSNFGLYYRYSENGFSVVEVRIPFKEGIDIEDE